mmetsp:Transcript_1179/g.2941  ORF Transcript_1179/g.2941 Transcript_1179/m.2941 type:complete len:95 (-) Transcript_1179:140-424(-)
MTLLRMMSARKNRTTRDGGCEGEHGRIPLDANVATCVDDDTLGRKRHGRRIDDDAAAFAIIVAGRQKKRRSLAMGAPAGCDMAVERRRPEQWRF